MDKQAFLDGVTRGVQNMLSTVGQLPGELVDTVKARSPYLNELLTNPAKWRTKLNTSPEFTHNFVKPTLDGLLSHHTASGLLGSGAGAAIGALTADKNRRREGAAKGALAGGGLGLAGSFVLPGVSKAINEEMLSHVRRPVGRVVTNLVYPRGYDATNSFASEGEGSSKLREITKQPFKKLVKSVLHDEPIYQNNTDLSPLTPPEEDSGDALRDVIFRSSFDLPPHKKYNDVEDLFHRDLKGNLLYNRANPRLASLTSDLDQAAKRTVVERLNGTGDGVAEDSYGVMGHYAPKYNSADKTIDITDPWDFDLHSDEKMNTSSNLGRYLLDKLIHKQTVSHRLYGQEDFLKSQVPDLAAKIQTGKPYL